MINNEVACSVAIHNAKGIGAKRYSELLKYFGSATAAVKNISHGDSGKFNLPDTAIKEISNPDWNKIEEDLKWCEDNNHHIILIDQPQYPNRLRQINSAPPLIYVRGNPELLHLPQLAMVGSRNPSSGGKRTAFEFAKALSESGITITSGLASGIDGECHKGALEGIGGTVAVIATGIDRIYPASNKNIAHKISDHGAIVSEFPIGTSPKAENFPRRNRIISGLSLGTIVVEAALKSGSLITAKYAYEQNREVFAIPGSIHNPLSKGCHSLIKQGAKLIETTADILNEIASLIEIPDAATPKAHRKNATEPEESNNLDDDYIKLLEHIDFAPTSVDIISQRSGFPANMVCSMLLVLEMKGVVNSSSGGIYSRI